MKKFLALALGFGLVFTIAGTASAGPGGAVTDYTVGHDAGGIGGSRHNLGAYGMHWGTRNSTGAGGTTEICVFCHTPHHGTTNAPLWNKGNQNTSYTAYGSTVGGTSVANNEIGAASLACLSCHDGVNTFDTLVNAPGKGNNGSNNADIQNGQGVDMGWLFLEDGNMKTDKMSSYRLNIGTNLTNDHPISITYHENRASLRDTEVNVGTINMALSYGDPNAPVDFMEGVMEANGNTYTDTRTDNKWSINGEIRANFNIPTILRNGKVECSSCHDPHFSNKSWTEAEYTWTTDGSLSDGEADSDGHFLRRVGGNSISGVCRTCHNK